MTPHAALLAVVLALVPANAAAQERDAGSSATSSAEPANDPAAPPGDAESAADDGAPARADDDATDDGAAAEDDAGGESEDAGATDAAPAEDARAEAPGQQGEELPARVRLVFGECGYDRGALLDLLGLELLGDGIEQVAAGEPDPEAPDALAVVRLTTRPCDDDAEVDVTVDDLVTRKQVRRVLVVGGLPSEARPRALALGIAELLRASWAELSTGEVPDEARFAAWIRRRAQVHAARSLQTPPDPPPAAEPPRAPPSPPALRLDATFEARGYPSGGAALGGGAVGASIRLGDLPLAIRVGAMASAGRLDVRLGGIDVGAFGGVIGVDLESGPELPVSFAVGPSVELGVGWASGNAGPRVMTSTGFAFIAGVGGHATLRVPLLDALEGIVDLRGGYAARGLEAGVDGDAAAGLLGAYLGARLGLGLRL